MEKSKTTIERELVARARRGDKQAFAQLYERIYEDLYHFALYTMKNPVDAEDAVSSGIVAAYENIYKLRKAESFRSWMFQIVSNQCKKIWRGQSRLDYDTKKQDEMLNAAAVEKEEASMEAKMDLWDAFRDLSERERMVISLDIFGGYNSKEIGLIIDAPSGTVRSIKNRSLSRMREALGGAL